LISSTPKIEHIDFSVNLEGIAVMLCACSQNAAKDGQGASLLAAGNEKVQR
jgi:hypothetical protein